MTDLIPIQKISETTAFKSVPKYKQALLLKRANRELIERACIHLKSTGEPMLNVGETNLKIVKELIIN